MISRQFEVSVWSKLDARYIPLGRCGEMKLNELLALGWDLKWAQVEDLHPERIEALRDLAALERQIEDCKLPATDRLQLRKAIVALREKAMRVA